MLKYDTDRHKGEQILLENQSQQTCLTQGGHKPSIRKKKKNAIICEAGVGLHPAVLGDLYLSKFKTEERTGVSNRDNGLRQGSANPCAHP